MPPDNLVKILFRFYSDILDKETVETMWAEIADEEKGYYKLSNIPFYIPKIASKDIIWAEFKTSEGMLTYRKTIQCSGNSTIHVIVLNDEYEVNAIRNVFESMGCGSEKINNYFVLDIPAEINYLPIKQKLNELEKDGVLDYEESCLSDRHQYKDYSFPL
jgi:hypothetical protein